MVEEKQQMTYTKEEKFALNRQKKEEKRQHVRALNEPPHLRTIEEVGNAVTHGVGALLATAGFVLLLLKSDTGIKITGSCFYGVSLIFLMLMSCLYHAFPSGSTVKRLWRRFDYSSIYLLIGGTFAPLYLSYWGSTLAIVIFCIQWTIIILGITMIGVFGPGRLRWLHYSSYFVIGWSALIFLPYCFTHSQSLFWFILSGGVVYTVGMVPFAKDKPNDHFIWHFFVLGGAILHWIGIYFYAY